MTMEHFRGGIHQVVCNVCRCDIEKQRYAEHLAEHAAERLLKLCERIEKAVEATIRRNDLAWVLLDDDWQF